MNETFVFPVIDMKKTGENIRMLREEHGMSARDLQETFGFTSPQAIYKWQWGQTLPDLTNLLVMAKLWNVRVEDILVLEHQDVSFMVQSPLKWCTDSVTISDKTVCRSIMMVQAE